MADIKSMINSLVQGNQEDALDQFNQIFSVKAAEALDGMKHDVSQVAFEQVEPLEEGGKSRNTPWVKGQDAGGADRLDPLGLRRGMSVDPAKQIGYSDTKRGDKARTDAAERNKGHLKQNIKDNKTFNRHRVDQTSAKLPG
jgi:hypothetical protein